MDESVTEVFAVRYATMDSSRSHQLYRYSAYREPDGPMNLAYYFWVVRRGEETILIDTGFHPDALATRPGRVVVIPPTEAIAALGIDPDQVSRIIISHFHYDHIGNLKAFPEARFTLQREELEFWTGPNAHRPAVAASVEASEIEFIAAAHRAGRVDVVEGDAELDDDISLIRVGGHCPGQQIIRVGNPGVVLCSDALHFYEEMERHMPFNVFFDLEEMYGTYDRLRELEAAGSVIVAGHDPEVMARFPAMPKMDGLAVVLK